MITPKNHFHVDTSDITKESYYALAMFPYPSGAGLHVGHASNFIINDIVARYQRMQGKNVLNPIGFDSFGLPTENYALKVGKRADIVTEENSQSFIDQLKQMDLSYDREKMLVTSEPQYYKWTQRIFARLFEKGLAYRSTSYVNRCDTCQTVLANAQVENNACERCDTEIRQKKMPQWFIKITDYADRLIDDLDLVDRPEDTKTVQKNWIGRSEGAEIFFVVGKKTISVFTTRPDTIYGVTGLVLAPENELLDDMLTGIQKDAVMKYRADTKAKTAVQRQKDADTKSGVFSGIFATHPMTGDDVPVRYADYVLMDYGTGAVMSVPAHDERDWEFATLHGLEVKQVVQCCKLTSTATAGKYLVIQINLSNGTKYYIQDKGKTPLLNESEYKYLTYCLIPLSSKEGLITSKFKYDLKSIYKIMLEEKTDKEVKNIINNFNNRFIRDIWHSDKWDCISDDFNSPIIDFGFAINSGQFNGLQTEEAKTAIIDYLEKNNLGKRKITYKLRDRSVSRQRYRGAPIPVYYKNDEPHLIPDAELPVILPLDLEDYKPKGTAPLEQDEKFMNYTASDGKVYRREGDTLDTFMCSSFYYLRFLNPHDDTELLKKEISDNWLPVDLYIGGREHTVGHLLYSRFIHKFLYDEGYVSSPEPFKKLVHQGMIHAEDGRKMSKRRGNVVSPESVIKQYSCDALRTYSMFMKPVISDSNRDSGAVNGVNKFLKKAQDLQKKISDSLTDDQASQVDSFLHSTIRDVAADMEAFKYNTAISKLMIFINEMSDHEALTKEQYKMFLQMLAPFATSMTQELREKYGGEGSIHYSLYPTADESKIVILSIDLPIQFNGKMRGTVIVAPDATQEQVIAEIMKDEKLTSYYKAGDIKKIIFVTGKIANIIN